MSKWYIYHKDGSQLTDANGEKITIKELEYSDSWMGECCVTVSFKNNAPINFQIGDYIEYRGERFELNYDPGKEKQARKDSYGEAFVYDSVKFNSLQDELSRTEFLDVVLSDNELHYTALPKFSFYVETLDDLLDRIQANLNEQIGEGKWKIFSRNLDRSEQRGCTEAEWNEAYGEGTPDISIDSKSLTIDTKKCWEALALVNSEWDVNFIVRGRNIYVGTAGVPTANIFKYGLGNGLYQVNQNADSDQSIITRLRAYGSEQNLPSHYYADLGIKYKCNITKVSAANNESLHYTKFLLDLDCKDEYFNTKRTYNNGKDSYGWVLQVTFDFKTIITGYVYEFGDKGKCEFYSEVRGTDYDTGDEPSKENLDTFIEQVKSGNTILYITAGINTDYIPSSCKEYADNLPNNMAINRLMLPGFPNTSLKDYYDSLSKADKEYVNPSGKEYRFSENRYRPYIDSLNIDKIGLRSGSQFFDTDDKTNGIVDIYPTIEEMVVNGVRVDAIDEGVTPDDDGRFDDGVTVPNVDIYLNPNIDFDITGLKDDDFSISMKDGMCGGRTFTVASTNKIDGRWRLTIERVKDDALELYFPYKDYPIRKGDHFVLTGIKLPDSYVRAASLKLLKYALALLDKNDYTRYVYQPKVDEIFMARQHDTAIADKTGTIKSLHDTLKAGDIMLFEDEDLNIDGQVSIDQLTIKEEEGKIPTYEITLREDKEVGTIQKIQQQISSLESGNGSSGGTGGATTAQVKKLVAAEGSKYFISKLTNDTASGIIQFLKGLKVGKDGKYGMTSEGKTTVEDLTIGEDSYVTSEGDAKLSDVIVDRIHDAKSDESDRTIIGAEGFDLYMGTDGKSHLYVDYLTARTRFFAASAEIRKVSYSGGTTLFSNAGSKIVKVAYVYDEAGEKVVAYKCYAAADDGETQTMNWWKVGMMALCQTFNVKENSTSENLQNRYYWRLVVATGQETLDDGKLYDYVVLSNVAQFQGNESNVPIYTKSIFANENVIKLSWAGLLLAVTQKNGMGSFAARVKEDLDLDNDEGGNKIATRTYYGYEEGSDAPLPGDVIVQAGDQVRWQSYGNVIKMATSTNDVTTDTSESIDYGCAPCITLYHNMGAVREVTGSDGTVRQTPWLWQTITSVISPNRVMFNTECYQLFQGTPDKIIKPVRESYEIVPSSQYLTRHKTVSEGTTPTDISFTLDKWTGGTRETVTEGIAWYCKMNGGEETLVEENVSAISLIQIAPTYEFTQCTIIAKIGGVDAATFDLPIVADGANGTDGKSVSIKGKTVGHYKNYAAMPSENPEDYAYIIVDDASDFPADKCSDDSKRTAVPSVAQFFNAPTYAWQVYPATTGDGYLDESGDLWVAAEKEWTNVGHIKGDQGDPGNPGESAVDIIVTPTTVVFDTNKNGIVPSTTAGTATIQVWKEGVNVSSDAKIVKVSVMVNIGSVYYAKGTDCFNISLIGVTQEEIDGSYISKTSGYAILALLYNGVTYPVTIPFAVNVSKFSHNVLSTAEKYVSGYTELEGKVSTQTSQIGKLQENVLTAQRTADGAVTDAKNASDKADSAQTSADTANQAIAALPDAVRTGESFKEYTSDIEQTARNISLSVSSAVTGRVNMLQNTACRKTGEGWAYMSGGGAHTDGRPYEQIETLTGMAGRNCLHVRAYSTLDDQGEITGGVIAGFRWQGNTPQGNVSLTKGKTYVLSWWARSATPDNASVVGEVIMESSRSDTSRPQGYCPSGYESFCKSYEAKSGWTLYTQVFTVPTDCPVDWFEINIFLRSRDTTLCEGYLALPCLEETDEYHGWSSNSDDYDYVGGNILDGASTFTVAGNLTTASDVTEKGYLNETSVAHASHPETQEGDFTEVLAWRGGLGIENQGDYTLSFLAKGSGEVTSYLYCAEDNNSSLWVENSDGYYMENVTDGGNNMRLTSDWKRYWVHWHVHSDIIPTTVIIRCRKGNEVYVTQPKLEKGATMTAWTEKKTDLVDKQALKKAGIDIDANQVTLYGDSVQVKNGDTTAALFEDGKIKADYINAETIVTNGFKGQTIHANNATIDDLNVTGVVNATSGKIGNLSIYDGYLKGSGTNCTLSMCPTYIAFNKTLKDYGDHDAGYLVAIWGGEKLTYTNFDTAAYVYVNRNWPTTSSTGVKENQVNVGLYLNVFGTMHQPSREGSLYQDNGNHAIYCQQGDYAGFRPHTRHITYSQILSKMDTFLVITTTWDEQNASGGYDTKDVGVVTLTLPKDPEIGQMFWILRVTEYDTIIKTTDGTEIHHPIGHGTTVTLQTVNELVWIIWDGTAWRMMWHMGIE